MSHVRPEESLPGVHTFMDEQDMEISDYPLTPIIEYGMDEIQAKAYKVMIMWIVLSRKVFPEYKFGRYVLPKGDPRKSITWKFCYKLVREVVGKLPDADLKLYIWAQLMVLKGITDDGVHPLIDPQCLVGPKAWVRWCLWRKRYNMRASAQTVEQVEIAIDDAKIIAQLEKTKEYLIKSFGGQPTLDDMKTALENRAVIRWAKLKKVSPYYILLSPWIKKLVPGDLSAFFEMDLGQYHPTAAVAANFRQVFPWECS